MSRAEEMEILYKEVEPYLCGPFYNKYIEGTPEEIKQKHKRFIKLSIEHTVENGQ